MSTLYYTHTHTLTLTKKKECETLALALPRNELHKWEMDQLQRQARRGKKKLQFIVSLPSIFKGGI